MRRVAGDLDDDVFVSSNASWNVATIAPQDTSNNELANTHPDGSVDQQRSSSSLVNEEEHDGGKDNEQRVLDAGRYQVDVAPETGHLKDVNDIVGHDLLNI